MTVSSLIKVVGPFRSGTNLMKYILEQNTESRCVFNLHWWKHAPVPTLFQSGRHFRQAVPVVVMVREPTAVMKSTYEFFKVFRKSMIADRTFSEFLRHEFFAHDRQDPNGAPQYLFPTPVDYWNQYYWSWLTWGSAREKILFIDINQLREKPGCVVQEIAGRFEVPLTRRPEDIYIPEVAVLPSGDSTRSRVANTSAAKPEGILDNDDVRFINERVSSRVRRSLLDVTELSINFSRPWEGTYL